MSFRITTILTFLFPFSFFTSTAQIRIVSYNVENLFDCQHDTLKEDSEYMPEGMKHWTPSRFETKIRHLAQVIANIAEWQTPALVGLCEVENDYCLERLTGYGALKNMGYQYLHYESPDVRGIDCALLYDPKQFHLQHSECIAVPTVGRPTRDHLYATGHFYLRNKRGKRIEREALTHIFVCHFPSQRGGVKYTMPRREAARQALMQRVDSILQADPQAEIIVMGDFNQPAADFLPPLKNAMLPLLPQGTYTFQGQWSCLDQFFVSPALWEQVKAHIFQADWMMEDDPHQFSRRPASTYFGRHYHGGYSDHLPIYLDVFCKVQIRMQHSLESR